MLGELKINQGFDNMFTRMENGKKLIIGCIHLLPMPNTPFYTSGDYEKSLDKAKRDANALIEGGANGCLIQTIDRLYPSTDESDPMRVAGMAVAGNEVRRIVGNDFKIGVQIMWNCITPSLAAAKACGADFTRCTALVGKTDSPFGQIEAQPLAIQNYRKNIDAFGIGMIAEIAGYHFINEGGYDKEKLISNARWAMIAGANAIEVSHKDEKLNNAMVSDLKSAFPDLPIILGGGTNIDNAAIRLKNADGAIVGSCFEKGNWGGNICSDAVKSYMDNVKTIEK